MERASAAAEYAESQAAAVVEVSALRDEVSRATERAITAERDLVASQEREADCTARVEHAERLKGAADELSSQVRAREVPC